MRGALLALAASLAIGVTAADGAPPPNVRGTLMRGPVSPVCVVEVPCERPAPGVPLAFARPGVQPVIVVTGNEGRFALRLEPGRYEVRVRNRPRIGSALSPHSVRVPATRAIRLELHLDTGIR